MKIVERSYNSEVFRPKPVVRLEEEGAALIIASAWGNPEVAQLCIDESLRYIQAAKGDVEVTSPFDFSTALSDEANQLRIGALLANESILRAENKSEYATAVEFTAILQKGNQLAWVHCGGAKILLKKKGHGLHYISGGQDHGSDLNRFDLAPLPARALGLERDCPLQVGSCVYTETDQLLLISAAEIPESIFSLENLDPLEIVKLAAKANSQSAFWVGVVDFT